MSSTFAARFEGIEVDSDLDVHGIRPLQLACARCGRTLAAHAGSPLDCVGFIRPRLPAGYAYIDELDAGDPFRFLTRSQHASVRFAARAPFDLDPAMCLLQIESHAAGSPDVIHIVEANTIIECPREVELG